MQNFSIDQIREKREHHERRADYFLNKQRRLPYNAHARRSNCRKLYLYHLAQVDKLFADVTGAPVQMSFVSTNNALKK